MKNPRTSIVIWFAVGLGVAACQGKSQAGLGSLNDAGQGGSAGNLGTGGIGTGGSSGDGGSGGVSTGGIGTGGIIVSDGGTGAGRVPANHRPSDAQCTQTAPAGNCYCPDPGNCSTAYPSDWACTSDSGCGDAGVNGRCIPRGGPAGCFCTNDSCAGDSDCPSGQTCACHGSPYTFGGGNACVSGNCRVDADCGTGGYCSPSPAVPCGGSSGYYCQGIGYYCHTPKDQCIDDSDCAGGSGRGCVYSASDGDWECLSYAVPL